MFFSPIPAQLLSPYEAPLNRNPSNKNKGKIVTLPEFLELAKQRAVPGILINIEVRSLLISTLFIVNNSLSFSALLFATS